MGVVQCCVEFRENIVRKESLEFDVVNVRNLEFEVVVIFYIYICYINKIY